MKRAAMTSILMFSPLAYSQSTGATTSQETTSTSAQMIKATKATHHQAVPEELVRAFVLRGQLKSKVTGEGLTIRRTGLADATLDLRERTRIVLDGKQVAASALPEGVEIRAKFQLEGEEAVALQVDAMRTSVPGH